MFPALTVGPAILPCRWAEAVAACLQGHPKVGKVFYPGLPEHSGRMTHASVAGAAAEVEDTLIRLSVGIEHIDDILADLDAAMT